MYTQKYERMLNEVSLLLTSEFQDWMEIGEITDENWDLFSMRTYGKSHKIFKDYYGDLGNGFINIPESEMDSLFDDIIKKSESMCPGINEEFTNDPWSDDFTYWSFIDMLWSGFDWGFGENRESGLKRIFS